MTPGRIVYLGYHAPLAALRQSAREGGPLNQWKNHRGEMAMRVAAGKLPRVAAIPADLARGPELCFLTGKKFWYQTSFCAWSLVQAAGRSLPFVFHDDGTFDRALVREAEHLFPDCKIISTKIAEAVLDTHLPVDRFPALRGQRSTYLHLRKLTDCHAGRSGPRLVLDSDMLFFRRPDALLAWLDAPDESLHMVDIQDAYGYPIETLQELAGGALPSRINVGLLGLRSETIDWEKLEYACATLLSRHGTSYYLEQALSALLLADRPATALPAADYLVLPTEAECIRPSAALHHYVAESKRGYFRHAWRHVFPAIA